MRSIIRRDVDRIEQELQEAEAARPQDTSRLAAALEAAVGATRGRPPSLRALGREQDDLGRRADAFLAKPPALPARRPTQLGSSNEAPTPTPNPRSRTAIVALAWFPAKEFPLALRIWPELAEALGTVDHREYCRSLQRHLLRVVEAQPAETGSVAVSVAPITIEAYLRWCAEHRENPREPGSRARYAAESARTGSPGVIAWPPGHNQLCWCGSERKYKQCCGQVRPEP